MDHGGYEKIIVNIRFCWEQEICRSVVILTSTDIRLWTLDPTSVSGCMKRRGQNSKEGREKKKKLIAAAVHARSSVDLEEVSSRHREESQLRESCGVDIWYSYCCSLVSV